MKMKTLAGSMLAVLLTVAVVTGCQGKGSAKQAESNVPAKQAQPGSGTR